MVPRKYTLDELDARIRNYYEAINDGALLSIHSFLDVDVFEKMWNTGYGASVHEQLIESFRRLFGKIEVLEVVMDVHFGENLQLYRGREYAVGRTKWKDAKGDIHFFPEHWVKGGHCWFTRNITPK